MSGKSKFGSVPELSSRVEAHNRRHGLEMDKQAMELDFLRKRSDSQFGAIESLIGASKCNTEAMEGLLEGNKRLRLMVLATAALATVSVCMRFLP